MVFVYVTKLLGYGIQFRSFKKIIIIKTNIYIVSIPMIYIIIMR